MEIAITNKSTAEEPKTCISVGNPPEAIFYESAVICSAVKSLQNQSANGVTEATEKKSEAQNNEKEKVPVLKCKKPKKAHIAAAYRIYRRCIKYGIPINKVLKQAGKISKLSQKNKEETTVLYKEKETKLAKSNQIAESKVGSNIEVAIFQQNYPLDSLNTNQIKMIEDELLKKIQAQKKSQIKPAFLGITSKSGYLVLNCVNRETANWVKSLNGKLIPWKGAELKIIAADQLSKRYTVEMSFPNSKSDSIGNILSLIQGQNTGLVTDRWKVVHRTDSEQATDIKFSLDHMSVKALEKKPEGLNYKWGQITFTLKEEPPPIPSSPKPKCTTDPSCSTSTASVSPSSSTSPRAAAPPQPPTKSHCAPPPAPPAPATRKSKKKKNKKALPRGPGGPSKDSNQSRDLRTNFMRPCHNPWGEGTSQGNYFQNDEYFNQPNSSPYPRGELYDGGNSFRMNQERCFTNPEWEQFNQESLMAEFEERTRAFLQFRDEYMNQATNFQNLIGEFGNSPFDHLKNRFANQPNNPQFGPRGPF